MQNPSVPIPETRTHSLLNPRNRLATLLALIVLLAGMGCLKTDPSSSLGDVPPQQLEDNDLRAGASSTTNWPPELGDNPILVKTMADSSLRVAFLQHGAAATDPEYIPIMLTGKISLYQEGLIPALDAPKSISLTFMQKDTLALPSSSVDSLAEKGSDTLYFNLRIETDSLQAWAFGFAYIPASKTFFKTPFSIETENLVNLRTPSFSFLGTLDTTAGLSPTTISGRSYLSFYIPGTPYYWMADGDSVDLGPLPRGSYPLRLLRVTYSGGYYPQTEADVFEVSSMKIKADDQVNQFKPGAKILTRTFQGEKTIRPAGPF